LENGGPDKLRRSIEHGMITDTLIAEFIADQ